MTPPLVSVIIPTYNRKAYVQQSIDSVLAQTYPHYEIIVIDDGSTDGTGEALAARYGDRISYHWQENRGESAARNRGIDAARGEYIAFLDSDDLWLPAKLERQVQALSARPDVGLLFCLMERMDADGRVHAGPPVARRLPVDCSFRALYQGKIGFSPSAVLLRRQALELAGGFDESIRHGEDHDLWLRVAAVTYIEAQMEALAMKRFHAGGQWYNGAEQITRRLRDFLITLEKAYQIWPEGEPARDAIRAESMAKFIGEAALEYYLFGSAGDGDRELRRAIELDPATWAAKAHLEAKLLEIARRIAEVSPADPAIRPGNIRKVYGHLARVVPGFAADPDRDAARLLVEQGYYLNSSGSPAAARSHFLAALRLEAGLARDRGLLYELAKTALGAGAANSARGAYRRMTGRVATEG